MKNQKRPESEQFQNPIENRTKRTNSIPLTHMHVSSFIGLSIPSLWNDAAMQVFSNKWLEVTYGLVYKLSEQIA